MLCKSIKEMTFIANDTNNPNETNLFIFVLFVAFVLFVFNLSRMNYFRTNLSK
jgi:hypothetical protein